MPIRTACLAACLLAATFSQAAVVSVFQAERAGLVRAWFTQAPIDPATQTVVGSRLLDGTLYVLGSNGLLTAYDAETGVAKWARRCGDSSQPVYGPTAEQWNTHGGDGVEHSLTRCGVVSASRLYVLDGDNGEFVLNRPLDAAAGAAPAITPTHAYVPQLNGQLTGYAFDQIKGLKRHVASPGQLLEAPILAAGRVVWPTTDGVLYGAAADTGRPAYRYDTTTPITGPPSVVDGDMYFANREGYVYGLEAEKARPRWRSTIGVTVDRPVVAIDDLVFVASRTPSLYAFNRINGAQLWRVDGLSRVVAASEDRVFALNEGGALAVLDRESGEPLASWPATPGLSPVANTETDRLYFVSESGLVQCFHDQRLDEPYRHAGQPEAPADAAPEGDQPVADSPADEPMDDAPTGDPFAEDPFSNDAPAAPAEADAPADDPFGGDPFEGDDPFAF